MSYYVNVEKFLVWLDEANFAPITKNKERKNLMSSLHEICHLIPEQGDFEIPTSHLTAILSTLRRDGKAENLTNDDLLNFSTSISYLIKVTSKYLKKFGFTYQSTIDLMAKEYKNEELAETDSSISPNVQSSQVQSPLIGSTKFINPQKNFNIHQEELHPQ
jgi:predicted acetyltransferase